jgi:hypothetical protein
MSVTRRFGLMAIVLFVIGVGATFAWPENDEVPHIDHRAFAAGPVSSRSVYWVGHSLMNARDDHVPQSQNLLEKVGVLAAARGLQYHSFDHTFWGSPLSLLWRGRPHGWDRELPEMPARLRELREHGARYDAMVLTEVIPVRSAIDDEYSVYYASQFACTLLAQNPNARIYLYETWSHLQASDPERDYGSPARYDWAQTLRDERSDHELIADRVSAGQVIEPGLRGRLLRHIRSASPCVLREPVFLVPVGTALARLSDRLREESWDYRGRTLEPADLFFNPYDEWPADWPREDLSEAEARRIMTDLPRRDPTRPHDDIHPSDLGVYFSSLVHFAVLYRQSPEGLPPLAEGLSEQTAHLMQSLVWSVVRDDPRTGVGSL